MPCDERMIKSQKTTRAITPVLHGRGSSLFSLVCQLTRTSAEESDILWLRKRNLISDGDIGIDSKITVFSQ